MALTVDGSSARTDRSALEAGDPRGIVRSENSTPAPDGAAPLDDTADIPEVLTTALARRAELLLLVARERDQTQQAKIDAMRSEFDNEQQRRAELLREMNALRDMAMEQMKRDDEVLKKVIALI